MTTERGIARDAVHDESYFISFSDLLSGLLFLFLIILMGYALSFRLAETKAADELARMAEERDELAATRDLLADERAQLSRQLEALDAVAAELVERERLRDRLLQELEDALAQRGIDVSVELEKGVLRLPEALLFTSGSADLTEQGTRALAVLGNVMGEILPCYTPQAPHDDCAADVQEILETVLVEGHTDDVPIRTERYRDNWDLAAARGVNTYKALTAAAPLLDTLANSKGEAILGVSGYEARRPVEIGEAEAARERNRRIDLRFLVAALSADELDRLLAAQPAPP